jgi:hypothetical protein
MLDGALSQWRSHQSSLRQSAGEWMRFKGEKWDLFGDILSGELSN